MAKPKKRPAAAPNYRRDKKTKSVPAKLSPKLAAKASALITKATSPPQAAKKERKKTMSDQIEELEIQVEKLEEENAELKDRIAELEGATTGSGGATERVRKWIRGKLPGERFIKTDSETGEFEVIDQAEFDSLA